MLRTFLFHMAAVGVLFAQSASSVAVSPLAGAGSDAVIAITINRSGELQRLFTVRMLANQSLEGSAACFLQHIVGSPSITLRNDSNTAWLEPVMLGGSIDSGNRQCTLVAADSRVVENGTMYALTLKLRFQPAFSGRRLIWVQALDDAGLARCAAYGESFIK